MPPPPLQCTERALTGLNADQSFVDVLPVRGHGTHDQVRVAVQVLCDRLHHDVDTKVQRTLQKDNNITIILLSKLDTATTPFL